MEKVVIPVPVYFFGNNHRDLPVGILLRFLDNVLKDRIQHEAIRRWHNLKLRRGIPRRQRGSFHHLAPSRGDVGRVIANDVNSLYLRRYLQPKAKSLLRDPVPSGNRNDHPGFIESSEAKRRIQFDLFFHLLILAANGLHHNEEDGNQRQRDPRALDKLGHQHHHYGNGGSESSQGVQEHAEAVPALRLSPVRHHSRLRQRERQKRSIGIEGNQSIGNALEDDQQRSRHECERVDALGKNQSPSS